MRSRNAIYNRFITQWCKDNEVDELKMRAAARSRVRMSLIVGMKKVFPSLSAVRMGEILGLDHSAIIYALNKDTPCIKRRRKLTDDEVRQVKEMRTAGHTLKAIADQFNVSSTAVRHWTVDGIGEFNAHIAKRYRDKNRNARQQAKRDALQKLGGVPKFQRKDKEPEKVKQRSRLVERDGKLVLVILDNQAGE